MKRYFYDLSCAVSALINTVLGGRFPETLCMRIRKYDKRHGNDYPLTLVPFKVIRFLIRRIHPLHLNKSRTRAIEELVANITE